MYLTEWVPTEVIKTVPSKNCCEIGSSKTSIYSITPYESYQGGLFQKEVGQTPSDGPELLTKRTHNIQRPKRAPTEAAKTDQFRKETVAKADQGQGQQHSII